jgi:hypothetical protein
MTAPIVPRSFTTPDLLRQEAELLALWRDQAVPELQLLGPTFARRTKALLETVRRMELWIGSMQLFRDPCHHQAAAAGARALSELRLDLKSLEADPDGSALRKFEAFPEVEHFRVNQRLMDFYGRNPEATSLADLSERESYVNNAGERIYETCRSVWGKDPTKDPVRGWPKHWTDQGSDRRARDYGPVIEEHHVLTYARLSVYIHSGAAGTPMGPESEAALMGLAHAMATQSFISALAALGLLIPLPRMLGELEAWARRWHTSTRE